MAHLARLGAVVLAVAVQAAPPPPAGLPRYGVVARFVARGAGDRWTTSEIPERRFEWTLRPGEEPPPFGEGAAPLDVESILTGIRIVPGGDRSLADQLKTPFPAGDLRFNRKGGVIGEAYDALYPGAPRLRRLSIPIYADLDRIKSAQGRYVDWPDSFERLAPLEGSLLEFPDARGGPERRWQTFTENNPSAVLSNFEYGLSLRERRRDLGLVTEYRLAGPRSEWVKAFNGVDVLTPLAAPTGYPAFLATTVLDCHIEFNIGNPGDGRVLDSMEDLLRSLKERAERPAAASR